MSKSLSDHIIPWCYRDTIAGLNIACKKKINKYTEIKFLIYDGSMNTRKSLRSPFSYCFTLLLHKEEQIYFSLVALEGIKEKKYLQASLGTSLCIQVLFSIQVSFHLTLFHASHQPFKLHVAINIQSSFCRDSEL